MTHRDMKEELSCPICMELFRQPRRLPCGHSYCHICLKAMLDRCSENSGLYLSYSRSIVCPECREEVSFEFGRGIEIVPPDFKLSKLVDLFKFMKKSDSSDSSGDEIKSCSQAPCPATPLPTWSGAPGVSAASSSSSPPAISASDHAYLSSTQPGQPFADTSLVSQPIQQSLQSASGATLQHLQVQPSNLPLSEATSVSTDSVLNFPNSRGLSFVEHRGNQSGAISPSSDHGDAAVYDIITGSGYYLSNRLPAGITCNEVWSTSAHANSESNSSNQLPSDMTSNRTRLTQRQSQTSVENVETEGDESSNVTVSSERDLTVNEIRAQDHEGNLRRVFNSLSDLGAVGGIYANGGTGQAGRNEPQVDSLEMLSNWVNENHCYSQSCHNLSHSSVSLPGEGVREETRVCRDISPQTNVQPHDDDRVRRAQSVPTEIGEGKRMLVTGAGAAQNSAAKGRCKVKSRKTNRGVFKRFVGLDTSSDSDESCRRVDGRSVERPKRSLMTRFFRSVILSESSSTDCSDDEEAFESSTINPRRNTDSQQKHIYTVSSSRPKCLVGSHNQECQSQIDAAVASASRETPTIGSPKNEPNAGTLSNPGQKGTLESRSQAVLHRQNISSSGRSRDSANDDVSRADLPHTSLNELAKQSRHGHSYVDSTIPKKVHISETSVSDPHGSPTTSLNQDFYSSVCGSQGCDSASSLRASNTQILSNPNHGGHAVRYHNEQTTCNSQNVGSPPTFYDNLNTSRGSGETTRYDNVDSSSVMYADVRRPRSARVRDSRFNPCKQPQSCVDMSGSHQDRTLYDNIGSSQTRSWPTSSSYHHDLHTRNPVTDIENLKIGYEGIHEEQRANESADDKRKNSSAGLNATRDGHDYIHHMAELDHNTKCSSQLPSQDSHSGSGKSCPANPYIDPCRFADRPYPPAARPNSGDDPNFKTSNLVISKPPHPPGNHADIDGNAHLSLYDNISSSISVNLPQNSILVSPNRINATSERGELSEDGCRGRADGLPDHSTPHETDTPARSQDELQYVDNYFDQYSQHVVSHEGASMEDGLSQSKTESAAEAVMVSATTGGGRSSCSQVTKDGMVNACATNKDAKSGCDVDGDGGSHSGSLKLQKKPGSRLKKFLTSLLSLTSSSDDDAENSQSSSSSESSGW